MERLIHATKSAIFNIASDGNSDVSSNDTSVAVSKNTSNSPDEIPKNILAFRTITAMLGKIQQEKPPIFSNAAVAKQSEIDDLRLSTAFANLANTDIEVIAIATSNSVDKIEVIVYTNHDNDGLTDLSPIKISNIWRMIFSSNAHQDDDTAHKGDHFPFIALPEAPPGVEPDNFTTLQDYIENECYMKRPTLYEHLWTLNYLLLMPVEESDDVTDLLPCYVITACFRKLHRRFTHETLSEPYLNSLKSVDMEKIVFRDSEPKISQSDRRFFLEFLPLVATILSDVPNILKTAKKASQLDEQHDPVYFYTKDTYKEFHSIFIDLLDVFDKSLAALMVTAQKGFGHSTEFQNNLIVLKLVGTVLQLLTRGTVLRTHLETIEYSLDEHRRRVKNIPLNEDLKEAEQDAEDVQDKEDQQDEDLKAVQPHASFSDSIQPMPLHESYREWLKLMLVHFDAIDVLKGYITAAGRALKIDIKILVSPPSSSASLPCREIFNSNILVRNNSNDFILKYYEEAANSNIDYSVSILNNAQRYLGRNNIKTLKNQIKKLVEKTTVPGWKDWAQSLLHKLDRGEDLGDTINLMLGSNQLKFFEFLQEANKNGLQFGGTIHCEASLASLLKYSKRNPIGDVTYEKIRTELEVFGRVIGVSKRCCPTCKSLLSLLSQDRELPFVVKGSHSTVSACTLPPWLPSSVVDQMNVEFGDHLRRELINLKNNPFLRSRSSSSGSGRISSDIGHGLILVRMSDTTPIVSKDLNKKEKLLKNLRRVFTNTEKATFGL